MTILGQTFGRLTAVKLVGATPSGNKQVLCRCACGNERVVQYGNLTAGKSQSCGCLRREVTAQNSYRHGHGGSRTHKIWKDMKSRCYLKTSTYFHNYGGRGITVCDEWRESFSKFLQDMGECPPGHSIERLDVNRSYEPGNCVWLPRSRQAQNRRDTIRIDGMCLAEYCRRHGLRYATTLWRWHRGLPLCGR